MEVWSTITSDYCRMHRGQIIYTVDVAGYLADHTTRHYPAGSLLATAYRCLTVLARDGRVAPLGREPGTRRGHWTV